MQSAENFQRITRRHILASLSAVAGISLLTGCGLSLSKEIVPGAAGPVGNPQPLPVGSIVAASMTVGMAGGESLSTGFAGLSYEKATLSLPLFSGANSDLVGLFTRLGKSVLRVGGTSVDRGVWKALGKGQTAGEIAPADVDAMAAFLRATGWTCIYGVNLGGSADGSTSPELAADEVAYVAQALGSALVGVEIGNECENYRDGDSFYPYNWTVEMFEQLWTEYRDAIIARTPSAPMVGPAAGRDVAGWTIPFGESVTKQHIGLMTQHYARETGNSTIEELLAEDTAFAQELELLREGAESVGVPFRMGQLASYSGGGAKGVSDTYASALWAIDRVFRCALGGAAGINFQSGGSEYATVIEDEGGGVIGPRPMFYGLMMASLMGDGVLLATDVNAGTLNVTAYAVKNNTGGMSLMIVNKDTTQNLKMSITLPDEVTSAGIQVMTQSCAGAAASLSATSGVRIQGADVAVDGAFDPGDAFDGVVDGKQVSCYVPALTAVVVKLR